MKGISSYYHVDFVKNNISITDRTYQLIQTTTRGVSREKLALVAWLILKYFVVQVEYSYWIFRQ